MTETQPELGGTDRGSPEEKRCIWASGALGTETRSWLHDLCVQSSSLSFSDAFILFTDFFSPSLTPHWLATRERTVALSSHGLQKVLEGTMNGSGLE